MQLQLKLSAFNNGMLWGSWIQLKVLLLLLYFKNTFQNMQNIFFHNNYVIHFLSKSHANNANLSTCLLCLFSALTGTLKWRCQRKPPWRPMDWLNGSRLPSIIRPVKWMWSTSRSMSRLVSWSSVAGRMMASRYVPENEPFRGIS